MPYSKSNQCATRFLWHAPSLPVSPPPPVPATPSKQQARPKLPSPLDFSSKQSSSQAFFNSCTLYLHLALEQFSCDEEKILWTLAFFKNGRAARWSENLFCQEADTSVFPIQSWANFKWQFQSQFFPVNTKADTVNTLEGSSYYQGNRTVDNYLDSFLTLVSDASYTNPRILVVKFCRELKLNIQSCKGTL